MSSWTVIAVGVTAVALAVGFRWLQLRRDVGRALALAGVTEAGGGYSGSLPGLVRDLVDRIAAAEASGAAMRAAIVGSDLGVVIAGPDGRVLMSNPAASEVLEGGVEDAVARTRLLQLLARVADTGEPEEFEFDVYGPRRRVLRLRAVPLEVDGERRGSLGYVRDLTRRYRVDAMRRDFIANAGHELKTPLGALSVLAEALVAADGAEARDQLASRLMSEAGRMARVVDDIVQLAEVESLSSPHRPVRIRDVVCDAVEAVAHQADQAAVELVAEAIDDAVVVGNREQLASAVANLLSNAITYTPGGGSASVVWYGARFEDGRVAISVEDHGIGIPAEHHGRIFERFYRVDRARSRASGGTGLGLSIVRNVARIHGGDVTVDSEPGRGSIFTLHLPAGPVEGS